MFMRSIGVPALLLVAAACQAPAPSPPHPVAPAAAAVAPPGRPGPSQPAIAAEVEQLRAALAANVPQHTPRTAASDQRWIALANAGLVAAGVTIDHPQLLVVVDRNPAVQQLAIVLAQSGAPWQVIGGSKVSTGQAGRYDHYITPTGVFAHTDGILDYRALGTFNENHIRGLGAKGMRVWDFGWQTAEKGWLPDRPTGDIRLLMHATDPDLLEQRLGRPASEGCVRVPATMNHFLDRHAVLDADYLRAAQDDIRFRAMLPANGDPSPLAGDLMVVVDTAGQTNL
jgi:hypothetical protein